MPNHSSTSPKSSAARASTEDALATIQKARKLDPTNLEAGYNEGLLLDVLGRFDEAAQTYSAMVDLTSHANGAYTNEEKNNRGIFLERLGAVYLEQNKIDLAIATYQKMIDMGGDTAIRGYQGQVDAYRRRTGSSTRQSKSPARPLPPIQRIAISSSCWPANLPTTARPTKASRWPKACSTTPTTIASSGSRSARSTSASAAGRTQRTPSTRPSPSPPKRKTASTCSSCAASWPSAKSTSSPPSSYFRQVLELDPANAMTLNYLGYMLADKGIRLPEALTMIRKAVDLDP